MPYDISIFTTIASLSASFVAILGGFIASKLITVNGERERITANIEEIDLQLDLKNEERGRLQKGLDEDDALDFIRDNISDLINQEPLDKVYEEDKQNRLQQDDLLPYWDKALVLVDRFANAPDIEESLNDDDIPSSLAAEIKSDAFAYDVCCEIAKECSPSMLKPFAPPTGAWYERDSQRVYNLDFEIEALNIQKEQYQKQKISLKKPRGMCCGITLFILFSLFNIIQPLIFSNVKSISKWQHSVMITVSVILLSVGLIATFIYLVWLLQWNDKSNTKD